jgi:hypothetical protein
MCSTLSTIPVRSAADRIASYIAGHCSRSKRMQGWRAT